MLAPEILALLVIVPAELINPFVSKLPPVTLPVTVNEVNVPTDVILG